MTAPSQSARASDARASIGWLRDIDPEEAARLIGAAADVALFLDGDGTICDVNVGAADLEREGYDQWIGRPWVDTVTVESRPKVRELLAGAADRPRSREINHPSRHGLDVPIRYVVFRLAEGVGGTGCSGRIVALGRDLRTMSLLQQRLVETQQAMEREYARVRLAETRYRMLFNLGTEPVVIVDGAAHRVVEANPAAQKQIGGPAGLPAGAALPSYFDADGAEALLSLFRSARLAGRAGEIEARPAAGGPAFRVSASMFRQENATYLLVRFSPQSNAPQAPGLAGQVAAMLEHLPDGFVVTDPDLRVIEANRAFLDLAQLGAKEQAIGQDFGVWLGRPGVDLPILMANLAEHGSVRAFATYVQGAFGAVEDVDVSAVPALGGETPCYGFVLRSTGASKALRGERGRALPRSVEDLTELVGRVSLKELVRETTDVIERLCIEAALDLSQDNRASAAQMLGLSRQSLYAKLRRHGLGGLEDDEV